MGYRKIPTIYTLDQIEGAEGLIVRMKSIRVGRLRQVVRLVDSDDLSDSLDEMVDLLEEGLVSWNLEDEHGTPVPADRTGIEDLEMDMMVSVLDSWLENLTGVSDDLGKGSPSGEKFPGRPLTMEAL